MPSAQAVLELMQSRRRQNLEYFRQYHPRIFDAFSNYALKDAKLNISPDGEQINLVLDGKPLYPKDYRETGEYECDVFMRTFPRNSPITTIRASGPGNFPGPRFFHCLARGLVERSPLEDPPRATLYSRDNYPLVVVTGVGLGGHIEALSNHCEVSHFVIYEPNPDIFAASLYTLDWAGLFEARSRHSSLSVQIFVGNIIKEESQFAAIWNTLVRMNPLFPTATHYLNHLGATENVKLIDRLNKDIALYFSVWGFYDDEVNQLNQCLHNLRGRSAILKATPPDNPDTPVFIVGAGPSLDSRIEDIKRFRDKAIIISCGSALRSLHHYGVKPDFHVELESHKIVVDAIEAINDPDWLKDVTIISPSHVHPDVISQFGQSLIYFKRESSLWGLFSKNSAIVPFGTPTCTNAAVAFCHYFGFSNTYLFGCDYGYKDLDNHHAQGSIYYEDKFKDRAGTDRGQLHHLKGINGERIYSTDMLFTSLRTVEKVAYSYQARGMQLRNCSEGVDMRYTEVTDSDRLGDLLTDSRADAKQVCIDSLYHAAETLGRKEINRGMEDMKKSLHQFFNRLDTQVMAKGMDFEETAFRINHELENVYQKANPAYYWYIRGSIWHLNQAYYTHQLALDDEAKRLKLHREFRKTLKTFNQQIVDDIDWLKNKDFTVEDPWLKVPLEELPASETTS